MAECAEGQSYGTFVRRAGAATCGEAKDVEEGATSEECHRLVVSPPKRLQTARLRVSAMCCEIEVDLVKARLEAMAGVVKVSGNVVGRRVVVRYDAAAVDLGAMVQALNADHLGCTVQEIGGAEEAPEPLLGPGLAAYYASLVGLFAASAACSVAFPGRRRWLATAADCAFLLYAVPPVMLAAWRSLRRRRVDISVLVLMSTASTIALRDLFDASLVIFLFAMARFAERLCLAFVQQRLSAIHVTQARHVVLAEPGRRGELVPVEAVPVGTLLSIRTGDQIPLDGTVVGGAMAVDESALTGEATPVAKAEGDPLYAGTVAQNGYLEMRTTTVATDSTTARIQRLVEEGQAEASNMAVLVDRFAHYYTPTLLIVAGLVLVMKASMGSGLEGLHTALLILVLACPCSLVMATPIATVCAVAAAAQAQVVVKTGGLALDRLAALDVVALDKTGTLTEGALKVTEAVVLRKLPDVPLASPKPYLPKGCGAAAEKKTDCCSSTADRKETGRCGSTGAEKKTDCCGSAAAEKLSDCCASTGAEKKIDCCGSAAAEKSSDCCASTGAEKKIDCCGSAAAEKLSDCCASTGAEKKIDCCGSAAAEKLSDCCASTGAEKKIDCCGSAAAEKSSDCCASTGAEKKIDCCGSAAAEKSSDCCASTGAEKKIDCCSSAAAEKSSDCCASTGAEKKIDCCSSAAAEKSSDCCASTGAEKKIDCCSSAAAEKSSDCCGSAVVSDDSSDCCGSSVAAKNSGCCGSAAAQKAVGCCDRGPAKKKSSCCAPASPGNEKARRRHEHHQWVLRTVAALEAASNHPLAAALVGCYCSSAAGGCLGTSQLDVAALPTPSRVVVHPGKGLQGTVDGADVVVGNWQLMEELGASGLGQAEQHWAQWGAAAQTVVFVAIAGQLEMALALADQPRPEAPGAVRQLRQQGLAVVMLTGDGPGCAAAVGAAVGVTEVEAGLRPEHKQRW
eukprot:EG_transcript_2232